MASAGDVILARLEWARVTDSERQPDDVAGIVAVADRLDRAYVDRWARVLGVADGWRAIRRGASSGRP